MENLLQLLDLLVREQVFFRWFARAFVAVGDVGVKVRFVTAVVEFADPGVALGLARQQVNLLEVFPFFLLLHYELAVARGGGELHLIQRPVLAPFVALLPAVNGCNFLAQHFSNAGYAVSLKVQQHSLPTGIEVCGGQCHIHGTSLRA
ncbi:UNVERIFIED_ORG: hypothetical protein M2154_000078 [Enterobacter sp. JUb101]|nr:hypothetical protein [Lelliottia amnigena]